MKKQYTVTERLEYYRKQLVFIEKRIESLSKQQVEEEKKSFREYFNSMTREQKMEFLNDTLDKRVEKMKQKKKGA